MGTASGTAGGSAVRWNFQWQWYLVSSKALSCNYDLIKKSFYRAFNAIYGKVGRLASADVVIELLKTKCMPILLYGLDACPVSPRQLRCI